MVHTLSTFSWVRAIDTRVQMSFTHDIIFSKIQQINDISELIFSLEFIYFIIKQIYANVFTFSWYLHSFLHHGSNQVHYWGFQGFPDKIDGRKNKITLLPYGRILETMIRPHAYHMPTTVINLTICHSRLRRNTVVIHRLTHRTRFFDESL